MSAAEVRGLGARLGHRDVLDDIYAAIPAGAVTGLVGPNGSGKSTLLRLLVGAIEPGAGTVLLEGTELGRLSRRARARRLALVEQEGAAPPAMTVLDTVLLGRHPHRPRWGGDAPEDHAAADAALQRAGADELAHRTLATLSGGERQRVHLARALAQDPRLLLLDEPTNHLDVGAQLDVLGLAGELAAEGVAVLAALHDLNHALQHCEHVLVLDAGHLVASGPPTTVLSEELVGRVYGVGAHRVRAAGRELLLFDPA